MPRILIVFGVWLLASAFLRPEPEVVPPAAAVQERIAAVLATLAPQDAATWMAAEERLAGEGADALPALREALRAQHAACATARQTAELQRPRLAAMVLGAAVIRLQWQWDPRQKVESWLSRLKTGGGDPYRPPAPTEFLSDPALAASFPDGVFYALRCPEAGRPPQLRAMNIFTVGNDGAIKHLTGRQDLEAFFLASVRALSEDEEEAVTHVAAAWLRLSQEFIQDGALCFLPAEDLTASYRKSAVSSINGWRASGKITLAPGGKLTGEISVNMTFDAGGQLKTISEIRNLEAPPQS